jgi:hypothetical protein
MMNKMMKTMMAIAAFALGIGNAHAESNHFHFTRKIVTFTSGLDGRSYWMKTNYAQQARIDGINLAHTCIRYHLNIGQAIYLAQGRAYSMMAGTGLAAIVNVYGEILAASTKKELNRLGYFYPLY